MFRIQAWHGDMQVQSILFLAKNRKEVERQKQALNNEISQPECSQKRNFNTVNSKVMAGSQGKKVTVHWLQIILNQYCQ